jgi:ferredoxin
VRARTKLALDVALLVGATLAWTSGLVLLDEFHMGLGRFRPAALGLSRLAWQNLHRLGAILVLVALAAHVAVHARPIYVRLVRALGARPVRHDLHEVGVYVGNATVAVTGFVAWLVVGGSLPLLGPAVLGPVAPGRHVWIDVHHLSALAVTIPTMIHVCRRWGALSVLWRRARAGTRSPAFVWPWQRPHATGFIALDTRLCKACADCARECPRQVLGMVAFFSHRHVRIERADACTGCARCVRACRQGAITAIAPLSRPAATSCAASAAPEPAHGHSA